MIFHREFHIEVNGTNYLVYIEAYTERGYPDYNNFYTGYGKVEIWNEEGKKIDYCPEIIKAIEDKYDLQWESEYDCWD